MKSVRVRYFAILREQRGLAEERLETGALTAGEIYAELSARHGFTLPPERLRAALNDEFAPWGATVREGDILAFIPPVAGG
ncbi:MAG TPA: MoaD/ThiS family protein [Opitutaceae bacterium]|nr:MoaD/ThiS family protein [Opitutaceae bacterium]